MFVRVFADIPANFASLACFTLLSVHSAYNLRELLGFMGFFFFTDSRSNHHNLYLINIMNYVANVVLECTNLVKVKNIKILTFLFRVSLYLNGKLVMDIPYL